MNYTWAGENQSSKYILINIYVFLCLEIFFPIEIKNLIFQLPRFTFIILEIRIVGRLFYSVSSDLRIGYRFALVADLIN